MTSKSLQIRLLGPLEVLLARDALELPPSKKVRALLGYLVATGRPHGRSALCDLFWKDVADPRAGLRWALSMLRGVVDGAADRRIVTTRDRVTFETHRATVDLDHVRSAVSTPGTDAPVHVLEEAAAAFRGEFLEDLDLPGCHEYETWCLGMRERTRKLHLSIRRNLTERLRGEDADGALRHALVRLRLDPLSEEAYIVAIDILGELGRVDPGLELYERCRRMLTEDLGARPSPELIAARRRLQQPSVRRAIGLTATTAIAAAESADEDPEKDARGTLSQVLAALPAPEGTPEPGPEDPPLVGRAAELGVVTRFARGAIAAECPAVIHVAGEPGIGKTRLLRELVREVRTMGGWALSGPAFEGEEIRPYGPWIDLVRSLPTQVLEDDLERDLGALLADPRAERRDVGGVERAQLFEAVGRLLRRLTGSRSPGLLILDDIQWLDASSAALLHFVVRTLRGAPLLIALAAREEEIEEGSSTARMVRSLEERGYLRRVPLRRLDAAQTATLVQAVDTAADTERIFAASEGNPLFALAMAASFRDGSTSTPATIEEELADRLERLDRRALSILPWAAALGRAFDVPSLAHVVDLPDVEIVEAIDHLERRRIIRATGADRYDFTHSLLRRAAYQRTSEPGRRMIHRSIARALDRADGALNRSPGSIAHHAELGGLPELAARNYLEAAEHSLWLFALDEAAAQVTRGLAQAEPLPAELRIPLEMGLLRVLGFRSMRDRRPDDLEDRVRRVMDEARRARLAAVMAAGYAVLMELEYQRGDFSEAARSSRRSAEAGRDSEPATAIRALAETAACLLLLDQAPEDARRLASEAFALADAEGAQMDVLALARALLHHHDGELEDAARAFHEVVRLGRHARDRWWEAPALTRMIMVELDRGDVERALARAREAEELADRFGDDSEAAFARALGAVATARLSTLEHGPHPPIGLESVDRALQELRLLDSQWMIGHVQAYAAEVELERGHAGPAGKRAEEAVRAARAIDQPSLLALARSILAQAAARDGSSREAAEHLDSSEVALPVHRFSHRARRALRRAKALATQ